MTDWNKEPLGIWTCKIGEAGVNTETGLDFPMRKAVEAAYKEITGRESDFIFSGWRGELTEPERAVVEDRLPRDTDRELATKIVTAVRNAHQSGAFYKDEKINAVNAVIALLRDRA